MCQAENVVDVYVGDFAAGGGGGKTCGAVQTVKLCGGADAVVTHARMSGGVVHGGQKDCIVRGGVVEQVECETLGVEVLR